MAELIGLRDYLDATYAQSVFDDIAADNQPWYFHMHGRQVVNGQLVEDLRYDIRLRWEEKEAVVPKTDIKLVYPEGLAKRIAPLIKKRDKKPGQKAK